MRAKMLRPVTAHVTGPTPKVTNVHAGCYDVTGVHPQEAPYPPLPPLPPVKSSPGRPEPIRAHARLLAPIRAYSRLFAVKKRMPLALLLLFTRFSAQITLAATPATPEPENPPAAITLDTPRDFPRISSLKEWQARAKDIREQILVSCGL